MTSGLGVTSSLSMNAYRIRIRKANLECGEAQIIEFDIVLGENIGFGPVDCSQCSKLKGDLHVQSVTGKRMAAELVVDRGDMADGSMMAAPGIGVH